MDQIAPEHRLRGISHDLRNLLAQVRCPLDRLKQDQSAEVRQAAGSIGLCVETCCALLTRELGGSAEIFADQSSLHKIAELASLTAGVGASAPIELDLPAKSVSLLHDHLVYRAIFNLLHNAVKANSASGRIRLSARLLPEALVISVCDDGPGLPAAVADWFAGRDDDRHIDSDCVGIGLPATLRMITAIGGTLSAREAPCGTAIDIVLPPTAWDSPELEVSKIQRSPHHQKR